jgi:hypothetical protein
MVSGLRKLFGRSATKQFWKSRMSHSSSKGRKLMGYIEIFRIDNEGAGWIDLAQANSDELFNLEVGLLNEGALFTTKEAE